jgi:hypothetical protein
LTGLIVCVTFDTLAARRIIRCPHRSLDKFAQSEAVSQAAKRSGTLASQTDRTPEHRSASDTNDSDVTNSRRRLDGIFD